ncbi:hypothetical protein [Mucilaginibacter paludis]|uniref:Uncharacterized protein n=1 Tax=Mucilaginibacter paludis DSM 18603 TaxID=714943 RepID=H1YAI2_9SPHI|nr:hypothetical protein [Mucilaginibacter paludis]EHQ29102.1 hypothetical protein Mucpa_5023 [Mucilaginibacter paludis DSM 18603]
MDKDNINSAISNHLLLLWWTDEIRTTVEAEHGQDTLSEINEICSFASEGLEWATDDDILAHEKTRVRLKTRYPFLSKDAILKIANMSAYFWK